MDAAMEKKLQDMLDRHEIWTALQRYGRGLDRLDTELTRSLYFEDAIDDHGIFIGYRDDFIEWANRATLNFVECHHGLMNHYCDLQGDDAHCETYYLFTGVREAAPHLMVMGRYIDHFQRRNGEWRIANRVEVREKIFGLSDLTPDIGSDRTGGAEGPHHRSRDRNDVSYQRPLRPHRPAAPAGQ